MSVALRPLVCLLSSLQPPQAPPQPASGIQWQRTLEDALAVQKATDLPLLICVNMDGEQFCEHFANETYRDPAFIAATRGWVCVVASPDRHNPFDYDYAGRRVECPRFPGMTCGEHIAIEPGLFERFLKDERRAPRHVGVSPGGERLFDHKMEGSMQPAIDDVKKHAGKLPAETLPSTPAALLQLRSAAARRAVEAAFAAADHKAQVALLETAAKAKNEPFDLLRMGLRSEDPAVFAAAAEALAATATAAAVIDVEDALARADGKPLQEHLLAALGRIATTDATAKVLHQRIEAVNAATAAATQEPWRSAGAQPVKAEPPPDRQALDEKLDALEKDVRAKPDDESKRLELALAQMAFADLLAQANDKNTPLNYEDARRNAAKVQRETCRPKALCIAAWCQWQLGKPVEAREQGRAAVDAIAAGKDTALAASPLAAQALQALARSAAAAAYAEATADPKAPAAEATGEAARAFAILAARADTDEALRLEHATLLEFAGARATARALLRGIAGRSVAPAVHERFRNRVLIDLGAEALRAAYRPLVGEAADQPAAEWFAGYADLVAAEQHVRDKRSELARSAYDEAIERFGKSAQGNAAFADSANHFAVLALAGRALLRHEQGDGKGAVEDLQKARELRPGSMGEPDGLGRKPQAILQRIARELREKGQTDLATRLDGG